MLEQKCNELFNVIIKIPSSSWTCSSNTLYRTKINGIDIQLIINLKGIPIFLLDPPDGYYLYPTTPIEKELLSELANKLIERQKTESSINKVEYLYESIVKNKK